MKNKIDKYAMRNRTHSTKEPYISFYKGKYRVCVQRKSGKRMFGKKATYVGTYDTIDDAVNCRDKFLESEFY